MKHVIRTHLTDRSDQEKFCFSLVCKECGSEWRSTPIRFSKAGENASTEERRIILKMLYEREHAAALENAAEEAKNYFNICPHCGKMVCDDCFLICEDLDICRSCAESLKETGEPISFAGWVAG
jgi:hypothetical protein